MESIKRRYTTPATPPPLVDRPPQRPAGVNAPLFSFREGQSRGRTGPAMVTFGWGPVILSRLAR